MITNLANAITTVVSHLKCGGVMTYPTEAVYGVGCDPFNKQAVQRLLTIKQRSIDKGLILIAADWEHLKELTLAIPVGLLNFGYKLAVTLVILHNPLSSAKIISFYPNKIFLFHPEERLVFHDHG